MQITEIRTDETMRELREDGTAAFPFEYYYDDVHAYDKHYIEWHWHDEFEWMIVENGVVDCLLSSEKLRLYQGEGLFINSRMLHRFESEKGAQIPNFLFSPELIAPSGSAVYQETVAPFIRAGCPYLHFKKEDEFGSGMLKRISEIVELADAASPDKLNIQIAVSCLWRDFLRGLPKDVITERVASDMLLQARMKLMLQFITENYARQITLLDIAHSANISKSEALRCFHLAIRSTPVNYLIEYRLRRAKKALLETDNTVTQIAAEVGMDNVGYFIRTFKKVYSITPKQFRNIRKMI